MKLYSFTYAWDAIKENGYLSASRQKNPGILTVYKNSAGSEKPEDIINFLESTFKGRFRSISCVTEIAPIDNYKHPYLNNLVKNANIISFDIDRMWADGIIEAIYCKDCTETVKEDINFENIYKIDDISQIDYSPLDWHSCDVKWGSPYNVIRHYMLVLKDGIVPPQYITKER